MDFQSEINRVLSILEGDWNLKNNWTYCNDLLLKVHSGEGDISYIPENTQMKVVNLRTVVKESKNGFSIGENIVNIYLKYMDNVPINVNIQQHDIPIIIDLSNKALTKLREYFNEPKDNLNLLYDLYMCGEHEQYCSWLKPGDNRYKIVLKNVLNNILEELNENDIFGNHPMVYFRTYCEHSKQDKNVSQNKKGNKLSISEDINVVD